MKKMKKVLSLFLALVMVLAMGTTAFAKTGTTRVEFSNPFAMTFAMSEYKAYMLLEADPLGNDKYSYKVNEDYKDALETVTGKTTDAEIIKYISELATDEVQDFADAVYKEIKDMTPDATTTNSVFPKLGWGYWLFAQTQLGDNDKTYSVVVLDTTGEDNITVTPKADTPELEKKVQEKNDSTGVTSDWQDGADYDINDKVPFKLTGTVSEYIDDYIKYYYAFHDDMSDGLTFDKNSVKVYLNEIAEDNEISDEYYDVNSPAEDGHTFDVVFDDLKEVPGVDGDSEIIVVFEATLNEDAVIGKPGNPNEAKLEYSNNPYDEGEGKPETGETPEDKVIVFTYELIANKVDENLHPLEGATFQLQKWIKDGENSGHWEDIGDKISGTTEFTFTGLDAGKYQLVEVESPAGYNKIDPIEFTIVAEYDTNSADPKLTDLTIECDNNKFVFVESDLGEGTVEGNVINTTGIELPGTGGIGTTIFHVVGGLLMVGAAILLITKKRMSAHKD